MKESMNLLRSRGKDFINKKWRLKIRKIRPLLILTSLGLGLSLILILMNFYCHQAIEKLDQQLNQNQKEILVNLDQKKALVNSRKNLIDYLQAQNIRAGHLMEELESSLSKEIELLQVDYQDKKIIILAHSPSQDQIKELVENLNKKDGFWQMKINYISNLNSQKNNQDVDLLWEFSLEGQVEN